MNTIQATVYGAKALLGLLFGHVPVIDANATINERLGINGNDRPVAGEQVKLSYLVAGNRGHRSVPGTNGIALTSVIDHMADNAAPYNPIPFCIRPVEQDLTLAERAKYCLRTEMTINGAQWYVYWGLRLHITPDDINIVMKRITTEPGSPPIEEVFVPDQSNLYPSVPDLPVTGAVTTTDVSLIASAICSVVLDQNAITEFVNAAKILNNGDERYAIMSEFCLCTGADRQYTVNSTNGPVNFLDVVGCQVYAFSADHKALYYNSQELNLDFEVGNQVPLLATQSIPTLQTIGS